jgi:hypothetical protein
MPGLYQGAVVTGLWLRPFWNSLSASSFRTQDSRAEIGDFYRILMWGPAGAVAWELQSPATVCG